MFSPVILSAVSQHSILKLANVKTMLLSISFGLKWFFAKFTKFFKQMVSALFFKAGYTLIISFFVSLYFFIIKRYTSELTSASIKLKTSSSFSSSSSSSLILIVCFFFGFENWLSLSSLIKSKLLNG